jgi:tripartite-type tricarboxylate transporter receptor subunit TctC
MDMHHARGIALLALAALGIAQALPVFAQPTSTGSGPAYPVRSIRMVVGFPPGGFTDILARQVGDRLAPGMGQPIVIDNRSGNAGIIGADIVAKSKPDGYTLLMGHNNSNAVAPSLYAKLPYDVRKDFTPIALTGHVATVLVVHPSVPAKTVKEFIAVAGRSQEQLRVASSGVGSTQHLAIERFKLATGAQMIHVPYKGSGPAIIDLIGGHIDANFDGIGSVLPYIRSGKLRALGVGTLQRVPQMPELPTIHEQGLAGFESGSWFGVFAPPGTPAAIIERWSTALRGLLAQPDFADRIVNLGGQLAKPNTPEEFVKFIDLEIERWGKIVRAANVRLE